MIMNIFRLSADLLHVASIFLLLLKMLATRSVEGVSLKTQEIYLLVFVTRYLDLVFYGHSLSFLDIYNSIMKVVFIASTAYTIYLFRLKEPWKTSYKAQEDSFLHWRFAVAPCAVLAIILPSEYAIMEILWTFSIYLEAVAILPQLIMIQRYGNVENLTAKFILCLGAYRGFYVLNWIERWMFEPGYLSNKTHWIVWISGIVQTALYLDFFYYYAQSKLKGRTMLPK